MRRLASLAVLFTLLVPGPYSSALAQSGVEEGVFALRRRDFPAALKVLEPMASKGHPFAQEVMGDIYSAGLGVTSDAKTACDWWEKAEHQDRPAATHNLGSCFARGEGRPQDGAKAMELYSKAAKLGHAQANCAMGELLLTGDVVPADVPRGVELCLKAAQAGAPRAQVTVGGLYLTGTHVTKDLTEAFSWMEKAAEQGETTAQYTTGLMYRYGDGVTSDQEKAALWLEKAAKKGHVPAQQRLGETLFVLAIDPETKIVDAGRMVQAYYWTTLAHPFVKDPAQKEKTGDMKALMAEMLPDDLQNKVDGNVAAYLKGLKGTAAALAPTPPKP